MGDVFNKRKEVITQSLIDDRITRGKGVIMKAMGICDEVALGGQYTIEVLMLLYQSIFLSVIQFNCQAWTR